MRLRNSIIQFGLAAMLVSLSFAVEAQQPAKLPRIGYLTAANISAIPHRIEAFRQGLREVGYFEGKNILIEWRSPEPKRDSVTTLARELVRLKVDVIVTAGGGATRPAKEATSSIPIVMAQDRDSRQRLCRQPCATRWKYHGVVNSLSRDKRKTIGDFKGNRSETLASDRFREFNQPCERSSVERVGFGGWCARHNASLR